MEKVTETWVTAPKRPTSAAARDACLVHIYPTGQNMGSRYTLADDALVVGRDDQCTIQIHEHSVSRRHALIDRAQDGFYVHDLQSTNGTFVNDRPISDSLLHDGDYLRVGNCIFRFLAGGNVESEYHEEIYRLTIMDGLTQIHNQRYLVEFLERELARSARHQRPLAIILFDIDWFKLINDEFGHLGGDFTLRELAGCVKKTVRREDLFARYGGEEFALVLVESTLEGAIDVAERIRASVETHGFRFEEKPFSLTISLGVAFTSGDATLTAAGLLRQADEKLYAAKRAGRNRVVS
jgi:two-component system, cell cycle response regulator